MSSFEDIRSGLLKKYNVNGAGTSGTSGQTHSGTSSSTKAQSGDADFYTIRKNLLGKYSGENTEQRQAAVSDWATRYNNVMQGITNPSSRSGSWYTRSAIDSFGSDIDALIRDFEGIKDYAGQMGVPNAQRYLSQLQSVQRQIQREDGWYQKYQGSGYDEVESALAGMQDGEEKSWLTDNRYGIYRTAEDYKQRSEAGLAAFESSKPRDREEESWFEALGRYLGKASDTTMALGDTGRMAQEYRKDTTYKEPAANWTEDQRNTYGYLYSIDPALAADFAVNTSENYRREEHQEKVSAVQEWATKNGRNASVGTIAAIAMMPLSLADTLNALTEYTARGRISMPSSPTPGQVSEAITGAVGQSLNEKYGTINEAIPIIGGKGWGDAYQLGTSIANSLLSAYTQGSVGTTAVFFGSAASSTMHSAKDRGLTDEQAIKLGVAAGLAEAAGEAFSIEKLLKMNDPQTLKEFFVNVLKQGGIEATEEFNTTVLNNIAEQWIMGDKSAFYEKTQVYMTENGMSEEEAEKQVWRDYAEEAAFDALGGFISGGFSTGIQTGVQKIFGGTEQAQTHHEPLTTEKPGNATELANEEEATAEEFPAVDEKMSTTENAPTLEALSEKYGDRAADMRKTYMEGQDVEEYDRAFQMAYEMGKAGVNESYLQRSAETAYLSETQRGIAYNMGAVDAATAARAQAGRNAAAANGKTGWRKGVVRGQGVKIEDMSRAFNDPQRKAYGYLTNIAEVTGLDIVLYRSDVDAGGNRSNVSEGSFKWNEDTIYIDVNAGLASYKDAESMAKYTMMRVFDHEFTHFLEKWNPQEYNGFRKMVFDTMTAGGTNVDELIEIKMAESNGSLSYDQAAREVIAEAMTDILPESSFVEQLARKNQTVFQQLLSKLKEFLASLKKHFADMGESSREAKALKRQMGDTVAYMEEIVKQYDRIAVQAVESYQRSVAQEATVSKVETVPVVEKHTDTATEEAAPETQEVAPATEETASETEDTVNETEETVSVAEETVTAVAEKTGENESSAPAAKEYRSDNGYTIRPNAEYGSQEITFDSKPPQEVRDALKANKYRWNGKKGVWYGKTDQKTIADALDKAYGQQPWITIPEQKAAVTEAPTKVPVTTEPQAPMAAGNVSEEEVDKMFRKYFGIEEQTQEAPAPTEELPAPEVPKPPTVAETRPKPRPVPPSEMNVSQLAEANAGKTDITEEDVEWFKRGGITDSDGFPLTKKKVDARYYAFLERTGMSKDEAESLLGFRFREWETGGAGRDIWFWLNTSPLFGANSVTVDDKPVSATDVSDKIETMLKGNAEDRQIAREIRKKWENGTLTEWDVWKFWKGLYKAKESAPVEEKPAAPEPKPSRKEQVTAPAVPEAEPAREEKAPEAAPAAEPAVAGQTDHTPSEVLAAQIVSEYLTEENIRSTRKPLSAAALYEMADKAFGGTQAEGTYNRKDAYDALELAVNKHLLAAAARFNGNQTTAVEAVTYMQSLLELLPTQTVRTQEQQEFQQFSTPPNIAYLAAWAANITATDSVLEPSAGIGGLAVFAKAWGAEVTVNELSKRRLEVLRAMGFDHIFNENAEQIDNILPESISPSVVVMNPPFSSTAGRTSSNKTSNAEKHIDQALARLREGGRLVAILGKGMNDADYSKYWNKLRKEYSIRANLSIDGRNYKKYGTTWGVQIVVIDKTGPQTGDTITGSYTDLTEVPKILEGIRNDRSNVEGNRPGSRDDGRRVSLGDAGNRQSDPGYTGIGERSSGSTSGTQRKGNRKSAAGTGGAGNRTERGRSAKAGGQEKFADDGRTVGAAASTDFGNGNGAAESGKTSGHQPELSLPRLTEQEPGDDGVYATFRVPEMPVKGGKPHPAVLVESAAMAAVSMPEATYKPQLPEDVVKNNLSDAQMVTVTYAGQAHAQMLPDGRRKGFFIGDGTGVGKGRQIAGIILDNFMQGRNKAVWISKNDDLYGDAVRDWTQTTGRDKSEIVSQGKFKPKDSITLKSGVLFTSYDKLKMEKGGSRLDQIVSWLGEDFDGVIAFDEAHFMGNLYGKQGKFGKSKGSLTAKAGVELQRRLPNARIVYVSATAATEVDNLAYAERIGLWGKGTAFTDAKDFISKIGSSGLAAMELVIRDMKAMGVYVARSISYNGVNYDTVEHPLDEMQTEIYDTMSKAWQNVMANVQTALVSTGGRNNRTARQRAIGNFYSSMQRFYNQVLTSMSMPSVIEDMRKELAAGRSCVLQIVNTNEAQQNKQLAAAKAEGKDLDELDLTPREALIGYLMTSFPIQMFEEYTDEDGNVHSRPVVDSAGNPVYDKKAIRQRDKLIAEVNKMSIPDGPLEMLFDAFGTEAVAENTGRSRRVVPRKMPDGSISRVEESRTLNHRTADVQAFRDGKKRILIFSDAGGTGKSYHAALNEQNQQQRIHYVLQPGWVASNAVQGFGRTHRSNEASAPVYKLVTTNIKGQKRFTSTIARRLDQLGALTKGQRDTGSGMFGAKDNLETDLAGDSLREFYIRLGKNQIEGIDGLKTLDRLGLKEKFTDEFGRFKINDGLARDIGKFLNRILALEVDEQNVVFDAFTSIYEMELEAAIQAGTLDTGMETVKADKVEILDDKVIREGDTSSASTHYIQAKIYTKPKLITTVSEMAQRRTGFVGIYKLENDSVRAVYRIADKTTPWGEIQKQYRLVSPNMGSKTSVWNERTLKAKATEVRREEWQTEWDAEVARMPEYNESVLHMLTGTLLPVWNNLPQEGNTKVKRLVAADGSTYLGRVIDTDVIDSVLRQFSVGRTQEVFTGQQVMDKALKEGTRFQLRSMRTEIFRSKVSGQWRLEITQQNAWHLAKMYPDLIQERIQFRDRYFIPTGEKGVQILNQILEHNPVRNAVEEDIEQFRQQTNTLTDRDILAIAAKELSIADMTEAERSALDIFRDRLAKLDDLQERRHKLGQLYREQQFGKNVDRQAAAETLNKMYALDASIRDANNKLLDVEEKSVLRSVLKKARKIVEQKQREHDAEILKRWRDRRNNAALIKKYRQRIAREVKSLSDWVLHPNNKDIVRRVPDVLKNSVIPFLTSIDFSSKQQLRGAGATQADTEFVERLKKLQAGLKDNIDETGLYSGYNDLPPRFMERLQGFIDAVEKLTKENAGDFVINRMTSDELKALSDIVMALKKLVMDCNKFHANAMFQHVYDAGDSTIASLSKLRSAKSRSKTGETVNHFVFWQQIRPAYAWERFGKGGKSIYDGLRRGQAQLAFNTHKIVRFSERTYTEKEVREWEKEVKEIQLDDGSTIRIKTAQAMSFYELSKDKDSLRHILGQGIRVATYRNGKEKISDNGHLMTIDDVGRIIDSLTTRQKAVADSLQRYMADQGAKWGNFVSVKRFGEELFGNPTYFPIKSDGRHLQANTDEKPDDGASLYALLNMGFTKARKENANNRIVLYSIFDVFANHMASMAQYNALSLPILDALKWFNYQQKDDVVTSVNGVDMTMHMVKDSVRDELNRVFGVAEETRPGSGRRGYAENFITGILKAFNGTEAQGIPTDESGLSMRQRYNMAQVAFNLRVVAQQPLAITRAGMLISYKSILRGMKLQPAAIRKNIAEMRKYSGIAAWKELGFYDINISRGLTDLIKHNENWRDKINETGMRGAEQADRLTWAGIWSACKEEILGRGIAYGTDDFFAAVSELFEEVIYKTQVVDSVLTKNEYMRSKGFWARTTSSFMSEPVTNASMLIDAYDKLQMDMQKGMDFSEAWRKHKGKIGRTAYVYGMSAAILAAVTAVMDAWRDDDEYETFLEKWSEAFSGNLKDELNPLGKLPLVKEINELVKEVLAVGWKIDVFGQMSNITYIELGEKLIKGVEIISDHINGVETNYTLYGGAYKLLQLVSGLFGIPLATTTREIVTIWNNTVGRMAPSYKVKTYDAGEQSDIKHAYQDGYLTEEEAMQELLSKGLADNEDEAYWKWQSGEESFSRYDAIEQAIRSGADIKAEMGELTAHGYTEDTVRAHIKTSIGKWYQDGEITKQQATDWLKKYSGLSGEEITEAVNKWSSKVVTGIAFDDIEEQFMSGKLTQSKAVDMYVRYGGYTKEKATETVSVWAFVKKHPECDGITSYAVADYTTYCEKAGVPAGTFYKAWKHKNSLSGAKKAPMMVYIDGLQLSNAQKDSLYYAFGWAESTIDEAPWH